MATDAIEVRLKELREQKRAIEKEINQHTSATRMDDYMADWKKTSDLKQKFMKDLLADPDINMSWKRFAASPDFIQYALPTAFGYKKSILGDDEWVAAAERGGTSRSELQDHAEKWRERQWVRMERVRASSKKERNKQKKETAKKDRAAAVAEKKKVEKKVRVESNRGMLREGGVS
jgi:hypothetical protein